MLRYALPGHDETRIDLFIYPFGQDRAEAALDHGMRDFVASLRTAEREGRFRALSMSDAVAFDLGQAPADGDGPGKRRRDRRGSGDADVERMLMEALAAVDRRIRGRRLDLAFEYPGQVEGDWFAMHSRGYLFYRHLYFFKGRVSATAARIDRGRFAALADRAMRELVPAVQAYNVGGCADTTLHVDPGLPRREMQQMLLRGMVAAQASLEAGNCRDAADEAELAALSHDAELVPVEYPADDWRD